MPLTMAETGREIRIRKIGGKDETRRFLESLGFVMGGFVTVVSEINGNDCESERFEGGNQQGNGEEDYDIGGNETWLH